MFENARTERTDLSGAKWSGYKSGFYLIPRTCEERTLLKFVLRRGGGDMYRRGNRVGGDQILCETCVRKFLRNQLKCVKSAKKFKIETI
jgi:hypothetical protein